MYPLNPRGPGILRILFVGGCHVIGYPVGEKASFPNVVKRCLQDNDILIEHHTLAHVKLTHAARLQAACAECRPDLLVLQVGHFELSRSLSNHFRSLLRFGGRDTAKSGSEPMARPIRHVRSFRIKAAVKESIDSILGHPLVDFAQFEAQLVDFLSQTVRWAPSNVILLSPLPCADPLTMCYRHRATPIMHRLARSHGIQFLDLASSFSRGSFGSDGHFFDAVHLGERGHLVVGSTLAKCIFTSLPLSNFQAVTR